jgi:hypothetical protein
MTHAEMSRYADMIGAKPPMSRLLKPGEPVQIRKVDPYGMQGRDRHPPTTFIGKGYGSPCDGLGGYVAEYLGWCQMGVFDDAHLLRQNGGWQSNEELPKYPAFTDEEVYEKAKAAPPGVDGLVPTHFYLIVVPGMGAYEFADDELNL